MKLLNIQFSTLKKLPTLDSQKANDKRTHKYRSFDANKEKKLQMKTWNRQVSLLRLQ